MQRIFNVDRWAVIEPGQVLEYPSERARLVRLEVNSADVANLYLLNEDGEAFHLARVCGRDTVEFVSPGKFSLSVADGACSVYTVDGTSVAHTVEAPVSFTRIVERRRRNPEIEQIAHMMSQNMERRLAQQAGELQAQYERRERVREQREADRIAIQAAAEGRQMEGSSVSGNAAPEPASAGAVADPPSAPPTGKPSAARPAPK